MHVYIRETSGQAQHFTNTAEKRYAGGEERGSGPGPRRASVGPAAGRAAPGRGTAGRGPAGRGPSDPSSAPGLVRKPSGTAAPPSAGVKRGEVPEYLRQRKAQLQAEKDMLVAQERARKAQDEIGVGMVKLTEAQKTMVLDRLNEREEALKDELTRMPLRFDTLRMQTRKNEIADELEAIEKTRPRFKRDVVIVQKGSISGVC